MEVHEHGFLLLAVRISRMLRGILCLSMRDAQPRAINLRCWLHTGRRACSGFRWWPFRLCFLLHTLLRFDGFKDDWGKAFDDFTDDAFTGFDDFDLTVLRDHEQPLWRHKAPTAPTGAAFFL